MDRVTENSRDNSPTVAPDARRRPPRRGAPVFLRLIIPGAVLAMLVVLMVALTLDSLPDGDDAVAVWTVGPGGKGAEPAGYEGVVDDTRVVRRPYFLLLRRAREKTGDELAAGADFDFKDLALNPWKYRGKPLRVEGKVVDVRPVVPETAEDETGGGMETPKVVYQTEIVTLVNGGVTEKYFLHTEEFPRHLSPGDAVRFAGYFYNRYKGKQIELAEGGVAVVVAPLLVGRSVEPVEKKEYSRELVRVNIAGDLRDRTGISKEDNEAIPAAAEAMKSAEGVSDLSYFDMVVNPEGYGFRGCVVRLSGQVASVESPEDKALKGFRRVVLKIGGETPFARYAAAYVAPGAVGMQEMQVVTLRGVFIKSLRMEGGRFRETDVPLMASVEAESASWPEAKEMDSWLRTLLVGVVVLAAAGLTAAGVIFYMTQRDRRVRAERERALRKR